MWITASLTLAQVLDITARHHGLSVEDLIGPRRNGPLNQARQIAMYLARELTDFSLPKIGNAFGGRDHTTVIHAHERVVQQMQKDPELQNIIRQLTERIKNFA